MNNLRAIVLLLIFMPCAWSAEKVLPFPKPNMEANYNWLTNNLRCQKCINQTLADSQSDLANDLKRRVYKLVLRGQSKEQIVDYLVQRFGDRVSYDPPFRITTALLWLSPFLLLIIGIFVMTKAIRKRHTITLTNDQTLTEADHQRLAQLLGDEPDNYQNNNSDNATTSTQERQP